MSNGANGTILIFDVGMDELPVPGGRPVHARGIQDRVLRASAQSVEQVQQNMQHFIAGMQKILAAGAEAAGEFEMSTVEVSAQISAKGEVGLAGAGVSLEGMTGIKILFERKNGNGQSP